MTCEVDTSDKIVRVGGEMTIYEAVALKDLLCNPFEEAADRCAVDLAGVAEIDTSGIQLLLQVQRTVTARGARFSLANPSAAVRETLELLHAASWLIPLAIEPST